MKLECDEKSFEIIKFYCRRHYEYFSMLEQLFYYTFLYILVTGLSQDNT